MTKEEFKQYRHLVREREEITERIRKAERKAERIRTIKDKVQSSMKEFPYIATHEEVDAPEPIQYTAIQRDLYRLRLHDTKIEQAILRMDNFILSIPDSRERQILMAVYVEGKPQKEVALDFDLTESAVSKIISKIFDEFN